ncbi:hypothetical protein [Nocardioides insulae]|uniref:hypothetical protein n=1 Tax=Nocardioides insulae TaxID=394734 RepID=UPI001FDF75D7|nr:hypothetical protein [Nocardioides insulae]
MLTPVAWIVVGYAAFVAAAGGIGVLLKAPRPRWLDQFAWMLEALAVVLALVALASLGEGERPESMATYLGYLAALVAVIPIGMSAVKEDRGHWASGVIAVTALVIGVVAVRVMMTR